MVSDIRGNEASQLHLLSAGRCGTISREVPKSMDVSSTCLKKQQKAKFLSNQKFLANNCQLGKVGLSMQICEHT